jgi:hypothetical protein
MDILLELTNLLSLKAFHRKLVLRVGLRYDMPPLLPPSPQTPPPPRRCKSHFALKTTAELHFEGLTFLLFGLWFPCLSFGIVSCRHVSRFTLTLRTSSVLVPWKKTMFTLFLIFTIHSHSIFQRYILCAVPSSTVYRTFANRLVCRNDNEHVTKDEHLNHNCSFNCSFSKARNISLMMVPAWTETCQSNCRNFNCFNISVIFIFVCVKLEE